MEYPVSLPQGRNWRTTALATAVVATVELLVLVALAVSAFGLPFAAEQKERALTAAETPKGSEPATEAPARKTDKPAVPVAQQPRNQTSVVVLNGNGITGAADVASGEVRLRNYILTGTDNAPRSDFRRTLVMYRPGFEGEAHRLARDVGVRRVVPLDGMRGSDLMGAQIALIVGQK